MTVKKIMNWMIAAILTICGGGGLTSCSNEDNPTNKQQEEYAGVPLIIHDADFGTDAWVGQMLEKIRTVNKQK